MLQEIDRLQRQFDLLEKQYEFRALTGYRHLLIKYMARVIDCEGISYIENWTPRKPGDPLALTTQDVEILRNIELEVNRRDSEESV